MLRPIFLPVPPISHSGSCSYIFHREPWMIPRFPHPPPPPQFEHLPAWGLRDDRIPGTDQAVRGGRHGQKLHSGFPPRKVDACGSADARSSTDACLS